VNPGSQPPTDCQGWTSTTLVCANASFLAAFAPVALQMLPVMRVQDGNFGRQNFLKNPLEKNSSCRSLYISIGEDFQVNLNDSYFWPMLPGFLVSNPGSFCGILGATEFCHRSPFL